MAPCLKFFAALEREEKAPHKLSPVVDWVLP